MKSFKKINKGMYEAREPNFWDRNHGWILLVAWCILIIGLSYEVFAYDPCGHLENSTVIEYLDCVQFYEEQNKTTYIINNITPNTTAANQELSLFATKSYVDLAVISKDYVVDVIQQQLEIRETDLANSETFSSFLTLPYMKDKYYSKEEVDALVKQYVEPLKEAQTEVLRLTLLANISKSQGLDRNAVANIVNEMMAMAMDNGEKINKIETIEKDLSLQDYLKKYWWVIAIALGVYFFHPPTRKKVDEALSSKPPADAPTTPDPFKTQSVAVPPNYAPQVVIDKPSGQKPFIPTPVQAQPVVEAVIAPITTVTEEVGARSKEAPAIPEASIPPK